MSLNDEQLGMSTGKLFQGRSRIVQHTCNRLTCYAAARDAGREGQGLQWSTYAFCNRGTQRS